jgi:hypothetical protein
VSSFFQGIDADVAMELKCGRPSDLMHQMLLVLAKFVDLAAWRGVCYVFGVSTKSKNSQSVRLFVGKVECVLDAEEKLRRVAIRLSASASLEEWLEELQSSLKKSSPKSFISPEGEFLYHAMNALPISGSSSLGSVSFLSSLQAWSCSPVFRLKPFKDNLVEDSSAENHLVIKVLNQENFERERAALWALFSALSKSDQTKAADFYVLGFFSVAKSGTGSNILLLLLLLDALLCFSQTSLFSFIRSVSFEPLASDPRPLASIRSSTPSSSSSRPSSACDPFVTHGFRLPTAQPKHSPWWMPRKFKPSALSKEALDSVGGGILMRVGEQLSLQDFSSPNVAQKLRDCLQDIHDSGVLHTDIRPANILKFTHPKRSTSAASEVATSASEVQYQVIDFSHAFTKEPDVLKTGPPLSIPFANRNPRNGRFFPLWFRDKFGQEAVNWSTGDDLAMLQAALDSMQK